MHGKLRPLTTGQGAEFISLSQPISTAVSVKVSTAS